MTITYSELVERVPEWLYAANRDLVGRMPKIIADAEEQLLMVLDHNLFQEVITGKTIGTGGTPDLIDLTTEDPRIMDVRAVAVQYRTGDNSWPALERRDLDYLRMVYADMQTRRPRYYAEYGNQLVLKVFPYPDQEYAVELTANIRPPALGPAQETNRITEDYSRAMEKATLRQASLYMKNRADVDLYNSEMMGAITEANAAISRKRRDETDTRPKETANVTGV